MKVSKKSLIVSIAVLCVCALSLSAASFAWFTNSKAAKIDTLNMSVTARSSLQVRIQGTQEWKSILTADDFIAAGYYNAAAILNDASTKDMNTWTTATFNTTTLQHEFKAGAAAITKTQPEGNYLRLPVEFRATDKKNVIVSTGQLEVTKDKTTLAPALRMGFNGKVYATNANAEATWQPASGAEESITLTKSLTNAVVATFADNSLKEGYYYSAPVDICVWIEGSDAACIDGNTPATVTTMLQFGQAA